MNKIDLELGKIYFIRYSKNLEIVGRFKKTDITQYYFFDMLHYWNGFERFDKRAAYCVHTGIEEIREATQTEKMALIRFEIEHNCI